MFFYQFLYNFLFIPPDNALDWTSDFVNANVLSLLTNPIKCHVVDKIQCGKYLSLSEISLRNLQKQQSKHCNFSKMIMKKSSLKQSEYQLNQLYNNNKKKKEKIKQKMDHLENLSNNIDFWNSNCLKLNIIRILEKWLWKSKFKFIMFVVEFYLFLFLALKTFLKLLSELQNFFF